MNKIYVRILCPILALLCFSLTLYLGGSIMPPRLQRMLEVKLGHLKEEGSRYDTLFLGSSRVCYGIDPLQWDQAMREKGHHLTSFNLGLNAAHHYEANYILSELLEKGHLPHLKYVVMELQKADPLVMPERYAFQERMVQWHSLEYTRDVIRDIHAANFKWHEKLENDFVHLQHMARRITRYGRARLVFMDWLETRDSTLITDQHRLRMLGPHGNGFHGLDDVGTPQNSERYKAEPQKHLELIDWINQWHQRAASSYSSTALSKPEYLLRADILEFNQYLKQRGIKLFIMTSPEMSPMPYALKPGLQQTDIPFMGFNFPETYPDLYVLNNRFDRSHLNNAGAARWTQHLTEWLAPILEARP